MWDDIEQQESDLNSLPGCIFCLRIHRKRNGAFTKLTKVTSDSKRNRIIEILRAQNEEQKLERVKKSTFVNYHLCCLAEIEHKLSTSNKNAKQVSTHNEIHLLALARVQENVVQTIIENSKVRALSDVYQYYVAFFEDEKIQTEPIAKPQNLLSKLLQSCAQLAKTVFKNRTYLHRRDMTFEEVYTNSYQAKEETMLRIKKVALEIRKLVKDAKCRYLPINNISVKDIEEGECDIPAELYILIEHLVKGPRALNSTKKDSKIISICSSIILTMSNGLIKPASCLTLALSVKSLTGSRKLINILNRMGHCISYTLTAALETELAYGCASQTHILPYGLSPNPNLRTHVAFDNFDKFVETATGKDTLHDTVGIVYQNTCTENTDIINAIPVDVVDSLESNTGEAQQRRRKYYSTFDSSVGAYERGTNRITSTLYANEPNTPTNYQHFLNLNNLWMFYHYFNVDGNERWFDWNAARIVDQNPVQKIGYLPNINMSPTSDSVVLKTLQMAQEIAKECGQMQIIVTYDLAIAAKAYRIQADMSPAYDNIFINLGAFHTEMSFFKARIQFFKLKSVYFPELNLIRILLHL